MKPSDPDHATHGDVAAFVAKWRAREPEMAFAEVFCPRDLRERFRTWGALVFEWREAAFELSDARPMQAKCGWWMEEALRCAQAAPRHPLTIALSMQVPSLAALPWSAVARGLAAIVGEETTRPVDREAALASVAPIADAIATMEDGLFDTPGSVDGPRAVAVHLLGQRLRVGLEAADGGRVPLSLLARHGLAVKDLACAEGEPALRDWAGELAAGLPGDRLDACLYRRIRAAFDARQLRERAAGRVRPIPPWRALFLAWRSARQGRPG